VIPTMCCYRSHSRPTRFNAIDNDRLEALLVDKASANLAFEYLMWRTTRASPCGGPGTTAG
jgi:hypothetical protein